MSKNGDLVKFKESQIIALQLHKEKLLTTQKIFDEKMSKLKAEWSRLLTLIGQELEISKEEAVNWHLTEKMDAFEYKDSLEKK